MINLPSLHITVGSTHDRPFTSSLKGIRWFGILSDILPNSGGGGGRGKERKRSPSDLSHRASVIVILFGKSLCYQCQTLPGIGG